MYLRFARRIKNGKEHRYWSIVESKRCAGGKVVQRPVLYLGEINDSQNADWCRVIETLDADNQRYSDRRVPEHAKGYGVRCGLRRCSCIGRDNGERAGWRARFTNNCNWIGSGRRGFLIRAKGPAGGIFCKRWCAIG